MLPPGKPTKENWQRISLLINLRLTDKDSRRFAIPHRMTHFLLLFFGGGSSAATMASSNTSLSLYWVSALHSTYLTAPSSLAILSPSSLRTGCIFCLASFSRMDHLEDPFEFQRSNKGLLDSGGGLRETISRGR